MLVSRRRASHPADSTAEVLADQLSVNQGAYSTAVEVCYGRAT